MTDGQDPTELVPVVQPPAAVVPVSAPAAPPPPPAEVARIPTIPDSRPRGEPSFLLRAVWFIFIGWWLSALAIGVAYFLCAIIIGLPLAFMIFNQLPAILTLRPRTADPSRLPSRATPALDPRNLVPLRRLVARRVLHVDRLGVMRDPHHPPGRTMVVQPGRGGHDAIAVLMTTSR